MVPETSPPSLGGSGEHDEGSPTPEPDLDLDLHLHLPRILCLHGGGTNARIFRAQCRVIRARLARSFRLVFADAPFPSPAPGPDVESVYGGWGPFRSWLRVIPSPLRASGKLDASSIDASVAAAVRADDEAGAAGPWVGLLGFSQGAGVAASLLLRQQRRGSGGGGSLDYRFAVLMAGRAPLLSMDDDDGVHEPGSELLLLPTIHVHGLRDAGIEMHRRLLYQCCEKSKARLVKWDGGHRVPITSEGVAGVVAEIEHVAVECGILKRGLSI
jgi:predicted esterase